MNGKVNNASFRTTISIGAGKFKQVAWYITNILFFKNPLNVFSSVKVSLLRLFGSTVGEGVIIKPSVNIKYPWKLRIGANCWIGEHVWIDNLSDVVMGQSVTLSQGALLLTGSHDYKASTFDFITKTIVLEDGVWIGAKSVVLGGVTCRSHSVLSVLSVAKSDMQEYTIYRGNPAEPVKTREVK
jgi:putative colanic acid biosynthesis acetyltransferase WcaF